MSGLVVINNDQIIRMPKNDKINSYSLDFGKMEFIINYHHISPIVKPYKIKLSNYINLKKDDIISIKINIPKQIYINNYSYSLDNFIENLYNDLNFSAQLKLQTTNKIYTISRCPFIDNQLKVYNNNDSISFKIGYKVGENCEENIYKIDELCYIYYSINFNPIKLNIIYDYIDKEILNIEFKTELYLELENGNYIDKQEYKEVIIPFSDENIKLKIIGPYNFFSVLIEEDENFSIEFNKKNKILIIKICLSFVKVDQLLINVLRDSIYNNEFYFYLLNENDKQLHSIYMNDICKITLIPGMYYTNIIKCVKLEEPITYGTIINKYDDEINVIKKSFTNSDHILLQLIQAVTAGHNQLKEDVNIHLLQDYGDTNY